MLAVTGAEDDAGGLRTGGRCCCCTGCCGRPGRWIGLGNDAGGATERIMLPTINGGRTRPIMVKRCMKKRKSCFCN